MLSNLEVLELTIRNITGILGRRWNDIPAAEKEVDEIVAYFKDEIEDDNIFNTIVTLEDLI